MFCSFLALLLKIELERRMKFADFEHEWAQVLRGLEGLEQMEATLQQGALFCAVSLPARPEEFCRLRESRHRPRCASCCKPFAARAEM
jgi:hypothetical protein